MFYTTDRYGQKRVMFGNDLDIQSKKLIIAKAEEINFTDHLKDLFDSKLVDIIETLDYLGLQLDQNNNKIKESTK